jgi:hypothetical protein
MQERTELPSRLMITSVGLSIAEQLKWALTEHHDKTKLRLWQTGSIVSTILTSPNTSMLPLDLHPSVKS